MSSQPLPLDSLQDDLSHHPILSPSEEMQKLFRTPPPSDRESSDLESDENVQRQLNNRRELLPAPTVLLRSTSTSNIPGTPYQRGYLSEPDHPQTFHVTETFALELNRRRRKGKQAMADRIDRIEISGEPETLPSSHGPAVEYDSNGPVEEYGVVNTHMPTVLNRRTSLHAPTNQILTEPNLTTINRVLEPRVIDRSPQEGPQPDPQTGAPPTTTIPMVIEDMGRLSTHTTQVSTIEPHRVVDPGQGHAYVPLQPSGSVANVQPQIGFNQKGQPAPIPPPRHSYAKSTLSMARQSVGYSTTDESEDPSAALMPPRFSSRRKQRQWNKAHKLLWDNCMRQFQERAMMFDNQLRNADPSCLPVLPTLDPKENIKAPSAKVREGRRTYRIADPNFYTNLPENVSDFKRVLNGPLSDSDEEDVLPTQTSIKAKYRGVLPKNLEDDFKRDPHFHECSAQAATNKVLATMSRSDTFKHNEEVQRACDEAFAISNTSKQKQLYQLKQRRQQHDQALLHGSRHNHRRRKELPILTFDNLEMMSEEALKDTKAEKARDRTEALREFKENHKRRLEQMVTPSEDFYNLFYDLRSIQEIHYMTETEIRNLFISRATPNLRRYLEETEDDFRGDFKQAINFIITSTAQVPLITEPKSEFFAYKVNYDNMLKSFQELRLLAKNAYRSLSIDEIERKAVDRLIDTMPSSIKSKAIREHDAREEACQMGYFETSYATDFVDFLQELLVENDFATDPYDPYTSGTKSQQQNKRTRGNKNNTTALTRAQARANNPSHLFALDEIPETSGDEAPDPTPPKAKNKGNTKKSNNSNKLKSVTFSQQESSVNHIPLPQSLPPTPMPQPAHVNFNPHWQSTSQHYIPDERQQRLLEMAHGPLPSQYPQHQTATTAFQHQPQHVPPPPQFPRPSPFPPGAGLPSPDYGNVYNQERGVNTYNQDHNRNFSSQSTAGTSGAFDSNRRATLSDSPAQYFKADTPEYKHYIEVMTSKHPPDNPIQFAADFQSIVDTTANRTSNRARKFVKYQVAKPHSAAPVYELLKNGEYEIDTEPFSKTALYRRGTYENLSIDILDYFRNKCVKCGLPECNLANPKCPLANARNAWSICKRCQRGLHVEKECRAKLN